MARDACPGNFLTGISPYRNALLGNTVFCAAAFEDAASAVTSRHKSLRE
jgi:hypothetical protein